MAIGGNSAAGTAAKSKIKNVLFNLKLSSIGTVRKETRSHPDLGSGEGILAGFRYLPRLSSPPAFHEARQRGKYSNLGLNFA
jgi:hypothetical protein